MSKITDMQKNIEKNTMDKLFPPPRREEQAEEVAPRVEVQPQEQRVTPKDEGKKVPAKSIKFYPRGDVGEYLRLTVAFGRAKNTTEYLNKLVEEDMRENPDVVALLRSVRQEGAR